MSKPIINVTINPDGTVEVAPSGFKGKKCKDATKFLEDALGMTGDGKKTAEYYETESVKIGQKT
ncbi:MAG TPA: DUF2997 domain-containing protein [Verrucomicrobiae bacterium]|nr:DUF2997 domain-containing protein [Verrucomicrobiae bacterium]